MEREINKFHALQLFTDTFAAETVHLTNEQVGIYIRLLCFAWTKNAKPFTTNSAYRICQCIDDKCHKKVDDILEEFFQIGEVGKDTWKHKRLMQEHQYLTEKYKKRSIAGKKGADIRHNANSKTLAPIPIPIPNPNKNIYSDSFVNLWNSLSIKRGAKFTAHKIWKQLLPELPRDTEIAEKYNRQVEGVEAKFVPHFSTWLSQRRWEIEENDEKQGNGISIIDKMKKLGYEYRHRESNFDFFKKNGKEYKIDRYDKDHIIQEVK